MGEPLFDQPLQGILFGTYPSKRQVYFLPQKRTTRQIMPHLAYFWCSKIKNTMCITNYWYTKTILTFSYKSISLKYQINNWITCTGTNLQRKGNGPESFMTIWKMYFHISSGRLAHKTPFFKVSVDTAGFSLLCLLSPLLCFFLFLLANSKKNNTSATCMYECMFIRLKMCSPLTSFALGPFAFDSVLPWSVRLILIQDDLRWILLYSDHFKHYEEIYNYTKQHYYSTFTYSI